MQIAPIARCENDPELQVVSQVNRPSPNLSLPGRGDSFSLGEKARMRASEIRKAQAISLLKLFVAINGMIRIGTPF